MKIDRSNRALDRSGWRWGIGALGMCAVGVAAGLLQPGLVLAVQPSRWVHSSEADLVRGETENTVVTNLGDIKLATGTHEEDKLPQWGSAIYDLQAVGNGDLYLAVGPQGRLLRKDNDGIEEVLALPGEQAFALDLSSEGRLLVALSGPERSRVAVLADGQLKTLVELGKVRYIWDLLVDGDVLYLATGTEGKLLGVELDPDAKADAPAKVTELLDTAQNNLLCLTRDSQHRIYAGTDTDGLVYRVTQKGDGLFEVFVVFDAPQPEIGAMLVTRDGSVYVGTADASQAKPGRLEEPSAETGRPELLEPQKEPGDVRDLPQIPPEPEPKRDAKASSDNADSAEDVGSSDSGRPETGGSEVEPDVPGSDQKPRGRTEDDLQRIDAAASQSGVAGDTSFPPRSDDPLVRRITERLAQAKPLSQANLDRASKAKQPAKKQPQPSAGVRPDGEGNAIYRISPEGFVTEVFRESAMILKLIEDPFTPGQMLVATGNEGEIYRVNPKSEETIILADLEPQQVSAVFDGPDGQVWLGTSNPATLLGLEAGYALEGLYTSPVMDAGQISLWGRLELIGALPPNTTIAIQTRSGNVEDPEKAAWSDWSEPHNLPSTLSAKPSEPWVASVDSPPARFLQYRLTLGGDGQNTPVVGWVQAHYVLPNLKPVVRSIQASYEEQNSDGPVSQTQAAQNLDIGKNSILNVKWEASDPNGDQLLYTLEYQPTGSDIWLRLAKDLEDKSYAWQTRRVPDGRYLLRVVACDRASNSADMARESVRHSDPILVDNSPPELTVTSQLQTSQDLEVSVEVSDRWSPIKSFSYLVDSEDRYRPALPEDLIFDSTKETFTLKIHSIGVGPHVLSLRAGDDHGNIRHEAIVFRIK